MAEYGKFLVSNTGRPSGTVKLKGLSKVRVFVAGGMVGEISVSAGDPLRYIREHKGSKYRHALKALLLANDATETELDMILNGPAQKE